MFDLERVAVAYADVHALRDVSIHLAPQEMVGLIGPSGAGKTTLLQLLNGTVRPTSGRVVFDGTPLADLPSRELRHLRTQIGVVPQQFDLVPTLSVAQNVLLGQLGRTGWWGGVRALVAPPRSDLEEAHALLIRLGIGDKLFQPIEALSGANSNESPSRGRSTSNPGY